MACHIPAYRSDKHKTMNITKIFNHMTLVHLVRVYKYYSDFVSMADFCEDVRFLRDVARRCTFVECCRGV